MCTYNTQGVLLLCIDYGAEYVDVYAGCANQAR